MTFLLRAAQAALLALALAACDSALPPLDAEKLRRARMMEDLMTGKGAIGGDFSLTAHDGTQRSLADFRGKVVLLYFGYTYCPDVCPTDLMAVAALLRALGEGAEQVQALYVTVDPERDTPAQLAAYVAAFHPRIIGLTGSVEQIRTVAERYKAYFAKVPAGGGYLMEHSANFYILDRAGRYAGSLPPGTRVDRLADVIRERLGAQPS